MAEFRVLIAGGRDFTDEVLLQVKMDRFLEELSKRGDDIIVVSGGARGADKLGEAYAVAKGYKIEQYLPDWNAFGKAAGFIRNTAMVKVADAVVAFWDEKSRGTENTIKTTYRYGKDIRIVKYRK